MQHRKLFTAFRSLGIMLILVLGSSLFSSAIAEESVIVTISSPSEPVAAGGTFTASVIIDPNNAIAGAQFDLTFDPSMFTVNSVQEGDLLSQGEAGTYFNSGQIDNQAGTIDGVAGVIISPGHTVSTTGTLAIISLTAGASGGICELTLSDFVVGNAQGQPLSVVNQYGDLIVRNQPPVLNSIGNKSVNQGKSLQFIVSATDPDNDTLTYTTSSLPSGAIFYPSNRLFSWTPSGAGTYSNIGFTVSDGELTDSESINITVLAIDTGVGGGGGGGGGAVFVQPIISKPATTTVITPEPTGKIPPPPPPPEEPADNTGTIRIDNTNGTIIETTTARSDDGTCEIIIHEGTVALDKDGDTLGRITMVEMETPPTQPEQSSVIGLVYDFGPDGASFDPPISLELIYDADLIPEGVDEEGLVIAVWDSVSNQWIELESTVNPDTNTITTNVSHFSAYAVLAPNDLLPIAVEPLETEVLSSESATESADDDIPVVNWEILGMIIFVAFDLFAIAVFVLMVRRRRMLNQLSMQDSA